MHNRVSTISNQPTIEFYSRDSNCWILQPYGYRSNSSQFWCKTWVIAAAEFAAGQQPVGRWIHAKRSNRQRSSTVLAVKDKKAAKLFIAIEKKERRLCFFVSLYLFLVNLKVFLSKKLKKTERE